jgi:MFS family permease
LSTYAISFVVLQPFSTVVARWVGSREWISILLAIWGVFCMAHAAIRDRTTFFVLRFFLGAAEAGFIPVAHYFISTLYPKEYLGYRVGLFNALFALSNGLAGLLANAVMKLNPEGIHNWQVLYLLEGGVTVGMAFMSYWILPGSITSAWMLTPDEKTHATLRMNQDIGKPQDYVDRKSLTIKDVVDALTDWRKFVLTLCTIFVILPLWSFFNVIPLIASGLGYRGSSIQLLTIPPIFV